MIKYSKIEFGIATAIFVMAAFGASQGGALEYKHGIWNHTNGTHGMFDFIFANLQTVIVTYGGFLALNYYILPNYWFQKKYAAAVGLTLGLILIVGLSNMVFFSYNSSWQYQRHTLEQANLYFMGEGFVWAFASLCFYSLYVLVREIILYQYRLLGAKQNLQSRMAREVVLVFSIWLAIMIPVFILRHTGLMRDFKLFYFIGLPAAFSIYFLNLYWLIPYYKKNTDSNPFPYVMGLASVIMATGLAELFIFRQITRYHTYFPFLLLGWLIPCAISAALSWWVYITNNTYRQLITLKTALGTSNANLQYLRSQINPHFLFNTLNTLYGTALMEKADKTGEGIQKLGDMMRFMLHENNQDRIALSREIEYLHNYIDLQNMRLALSPDMAIDIQIEDIVGYYEIAPMLLIPFIENAYKHGISLQERSWIVVSLYKTGDTLHLDVHNSIHPVNTNDPERFHSGTGLDNVKQRLQLLYPQKHELVVRQNVKEFFVHLTITLTTQTIS